jgi:hypothetical protein
VKTIKLKYKDLKQAGHEQRRHSHNSHGKEHGHGHRDSSHSPAKKEKANNAAQSPLIKTHAEDEE